MLPNSYVLQSLVAQHQDTVRRQAARVQTLRAARATPLHPDRPPPPPVTVRRWRWRLRWI